MSGGPVNECFVRPQELRKTFFFENFKNSVPDRVMEKPDFILLFSWESDLQLARLVWFYTYALSQTFSMSHALLLE